MLPSSKELRYCDDVSFYLDRTQTNNNNWTNVSKFFQDLTGSPKNLEYST
jgi:hypothetical protein